MTKYDLGIIGGGPAGYVAAEKAGKNGMPVVLFDKKNIGGVCLNEGCIPTKTYLYSAKIMNQLSKGEKYGIKVKNAEADFDQIYKRKNIIVKKLVKGVENRLKRVKVEIIGEEATILENNNSGIVVQSASGLYQLKNLLVCTGSEPAIPPIPGLERDQILTNTEILQLDKIPESLTVIGGGVVGVEFADIFSSFGCKVVVIEMLPEILPGSDAQLAGMLRAELEKKGVVFHLNSKVTALKNGKVTFTTRDKEQGISSEKILVSTGRKPVTVGLGLENIGVDMQKGAIRTDHFCRTNIPHVYAAGDVNGKSLLAHTASREGEVAVNHMLGIKDQMRYHAIPYVVYTNPEFSGVGITEADAKEKGIPVKVQSMPNTYAGRFMVENEGFSGLTKVIVKEPNHELIGFHMLGNPSSEIIYGAAMAIEMQMTVEDLDKIVFPHPTVSEIFKESIISFTL